MSTAERTTRSTARSGRFVTGLIGLVATVAIAGATSGTVAAHDLATVPVGVVCTAEEHRWSGTLTLDAAASWTPLGVEVPTRPGTSIEVVGTSADGIDADGRAHPLPVSVGGTPAAAGSRVDGGEIAVAGIDGTPVTLTGVTVAVQRCSEVQSAAPAVEGAPAGRAPSLPGVEPSSPAIGAVLLVIGAVGVASAGVALVAATRRRRHC